MKRIAIKQVDAFTRIPFGGNPAGVVTDAIHITDEEKQKIAREMNLSETAFVSPSAVADFKVQFFTPRFEVDLCGHASIATFSTLYEEQKLNPTKTVYTQETKAGVLPIELTNVSGETVFMMTQPLPKFEAIDVDGKRLSELLGLQENDLMALPAAKVNTGLWWLVVGIKSLEKLQNIKPNLTAIEELSEQYGFIGITPFCLETLDKNYSYHLRAIAPYVGIAEDPVCGTGNGSVASYIIQNKLIAWEESINLIGEQGQEVDRPGCVYAIISMQNNEITGVKIGGTAVTVLEGKMVF